MLWGQTRSQVSSFLDYIIISHQTTYLDYKLCIQIRHNWLHSLNWLIWMILNNLTYFWAWHLLLVFVLRKRKWSAMHQTNQSIYSKWCCTREITSTGESTKIEHYIATVGLLTQSFMLTHPLLNRIELVAIYPSTKNAYSLRFNGLVIVIVIYNIYMANNCIK